MHRRGLRKGLLCGLALLCLVNTAFGLDPTRKISQYVHDKWGDDKGFVGGRIYAIRQSSDGYLWMGTERGLVRFDGSNFILIKRPLPDSPPISHVRDLVTDASGNLWTRLEGPSMLLYRDGKFEDPYARFDLQDMTFTATVADDAGRVILSGLGEGTFRYEDGRLETIVSADQNPGIVISLATTRDQSIWLGTQANGLFRVSQGHISRVAQELKDLKINALLPADTGGVWIGTDNGLHLWEGGVLAKLNLPSPLRQLQILTMVRDDDANIWIGTNHGIVRITRSGAVSLDQLNPKSGYEVTAIYEDLNGDIWFGGSRGVERLRNGMFTTYSTSDGLPSSGMGSVYADSKGRVWFAPLSGGLFWMKEGRVGHVSVDGLDHDVVYSISGGGGEVCVGRQQGGLTVLTEEGDSFTARTYTEADGLAQNSVYSVHRDRDGTIWAGTVSAGVSRLKGGKFTNFSDANGLPSNAVNSIVEGFDGATWLATPSGLASFANGHWSKYTARDGLSSSMVRTVFEDTTHVLWLATSGGLAFLSSGQIQVPERLPEALREQIFGIAEDGTGSLWFTTSDHILRVNKDRLLSGTLSDLDVQSYGVEDGLLGVEGVSRDRTVVADHLGRIWIALKSGLSLADPIVTSKDAVPTKVRIESMAAGGSRVNMQNPIKISSGIQSITLNYGSTNLAVPERIRFRYKLDGSGQGWSETVASRQVVYNNLGPGTYLFRIVASNSAGLWNGPETSVPFVIEPAFWQTLWFRMACLAACCLIVLAIYRLRIHQLTGRLNVGFQERLAERTRIAQELHDTLLQGVLSASLQLDVAEDQLPEDSPAKPLLKRVLQLMSTVTEEGRNALRGLRTMEPGNQSLETSFSLLRQEFSLDGKTDYRVIVDSVARPLRPLIRDEVYRIGREALLNAFMHAHANRIEVEVDYSSRHLRVLVRDDGRGIDPQVLHAGREGHWGLVGIRERSERIGANLRLRSRIGAGTEVDLTVPGSIAFEKDSNGSISQWFRWLRRERLETPKHDKGK
ncbi:sensor histidine kinase [Tunturiibacter lichenicola]|uniref:sensor histidine kinase n=1 Tax=Tunturiibacter lichenicola TaxID=2051959 RepID=UPI0021B1A0B9|nr:sensor histidine kinase [Edaphobacter lichenicola]